ncbi:hypothetical protein MTO98_09450 [Mucilaginibacter sp. SMC90]|uniref:hypothetical protein n=1 Tax=Mucilaginibacter sp. SMC90 TaxID=2929803 RepID=UPI001FB215C4|nr:hypothetical protein [Mucilaginibacter sp. SMC90]UOE51302.1 hypothetical protein MTO98_09450 [Mucilaginibacter sp. SMC90]
MPKPIFFTLLCLLLHSSKSLAQQGVWDGGKEQLLKVKEAGNKNVNAVKQWKKHAEKWGLDSNYNYAFSLSGRLNTNGWSGGVQYVHGQKHHNKTIWQLYFSEIKHEKEIKQQGQASSYNDLGKTSPYIFGKINNAYTLQLGFGKEQMLFPALMDGNMSVSFRYIAGPALALLKPYYLKLIYVDYFPEPVAHLQSEKYSAGNDSHFMQPGTILGKDSWSKGLSEIKYLPGLFAECYFIIEPDRPKAFIKAVSIGGNVAFYSSKISIMADKKAYPYQASFFVGLSLGKRWK